MVRRQVTVNRRALRLAVACATLLASSLAAQSVSPRRGTVRREAFHSAALGVTKHYLVYLPPSYASSHRRYPVAYYLHGVGGNEGDWMVRGHLAEAEDSLVAAGGAEMILVTPDGDDSFYTTWRQPPTPAECADSLLAEAPADYCVRQARYAEYVARDLVRWVDAHYRTRADRAHRGIAGLSMGGYGAVTLALEFPDVFAAAASHSGVLSLLVDRSGSATPRYFTSLDSLHARFSGYWKQIHWAFGDSLEGWRAGEPSRMAAELRERGATIPALYMDVGRSDPYASATRAFASELDRLGVAHEVHELDGSHTWKYWSSNVPRSLAWLAARIARR